MRARVAINDGLTIVVVVVVVVVVVFVVVFVVFVVFVFVVERRRNRLDRAELRGRRVSSQQQEKRRRLNSLRQTYEKSDNKRPLGTVRVSIVAVFDTRMKLHHKWQSIGWEGKSSAGWIRLSSGQSGTCNFIQRYI